MGSIISICRRRDNTLNDIEGQAINIEEDFEQFTENDELLIVKSEQTTHDNTTDPLMKRPASPYLSKKFNKKLNKHNIV